MMPAKSERSTMARNVALYPWFRFAQNLVFWQATWFLFFQSELSAGEAILLYAIYDVGTTVLEVPSGYMSDRLGRRVTLICAALAGAAATTLLALGEGFGVFVLAQVLLGASAAFTSGTDSAFLYESLAAEGRQNEIETQEVKSWRYAFVALALTAVAGGVLAFYDPVLPFAAGAAGFLVCLVLVLTFNEPPRAVSPAETGGLRAQAAAMRVALRRPVLVWLFLLFVVMYGYSHIPFVFGQPFILEALRGAGFEAEAPIVSGSVSAIMMLLSVAVSLFALRLRNAIGLPAILLLAFGMQVGLAGLLALSNAPWAIALLFLRMVPNSLSQPFVTARIQPLLSDDSRATYMSVQSFCARLLFAISLFFASQGASGTGEMAYSEVSRLLVWYTMAGIVIWLLLAATVRRAGVAGRNSD